MLPDMTERKKREEMVRLFIKHIPSAVAMFDREMRYIACSDRWLSDYGLGQQNLIGRSHYEVFPEINEEWKTIHARCLRGEWMKREEDRFLRKDGSTQWLRWEIYPWKASDERVGGIIIYTEDITDRKNIEITLRESEERFHTLANAIPQLAWIAHPDGHIFWYNQRWYEYTGTTPGQVEGWGWQSLMDPALLPGIVEKWKNSLATGEPLEMEIPLRGADGSFRLFLTRVMPLKDSAGRVIQWFGTNTDISGRKCMEDSLRTYTRELESANADLESFSHSISHDFRNFLAILTSMSYVLEEFYFNRLDGDGKKCVLEIRNTTDKMAHLIDGLLRFSQTAHQEPRRTEVNISRISAAIVAELKERERYGRIVFDIEPALTATADPDLMTIALSNLIGNACKFSGTTEKPHITIGCTMRDGRKTFFVKDNGPGFDPSSAKAIFAPFKRLRTGEEGCGLGLAIVERIIRHHNGRIWAESEPGKGATFFFTLPE